RSDRTRVRHHHVRCGHATTRCTGRDGEQDPMTPVFRHGRLRLYLLRLLDEEPRHGYEVIRLLQDRFMGVYSPSPGTIYPRLARLEEEGLVTHGESGGRKVYRITEDVRETVGSLREELTWAAREMHGETQPQARGRARASAGRGGAAARGTGDDTTTHSPRARAGHGGARGA